VAAFPSIVPGYPIIERVRWKTIISSFDELGEEQRKQKWLYPRRDIVLKYPGLTISQAQTLWDFYVARKGSYEAFNLFYDSIGKSAETYTGEYVGTGDGSTTVFNLPSKNAASRTLYVDGVAQTEGTNWTFTSGGGTDGADKCEFTSAPSSGQRITFDFTGYLKVRCRFAKDIAEFEHFIYSAKRIGLELRGLLNA